MNRLACGFEIKFSNSEEGTFSGYASVFSNIDSHGDIVAKGAFADTLAEAKRTNTLPAMLLQHGMGSTVEDSLPVGKWESMKEDDTGLYVEGKIATKTSRGADVYELMKFGALNGMSIGYRATKSTMHGKNNAARRTLQAVKLFEVSLVSDPSNGLARVDAVKSAMQINSKKELENFLRDEGGFSRKAAKLIASGDVEAAFNLRDEDGADDQEEVKQILQLRDLFSSK
jgi:HK97 family phage prohead protease